MLGADSRPRGVAVDRNVVGDVCPGWDSNPHWTVFETAASAVGLPGRASEAIRPRALPHCSIRIDGSGSGADCSTEKPVGYP